MIFYYILKDKIPIACDDVVTWGKFFENVENRIVGKTNVGKIEISTVFLGLEHIGGMFETMIFGGKHDQYQERCETWEGAETQHREAVELVKEMV